MTSTAATSSASISGSSQASTTTHSGAPNATLSPTSNGRSAGTPSCWIST